MVYRHILDCLDVTDQCPLSSNIKVVDKVLPGNKASTTSEIIRAQHASLLNNYLTDDFQVMYTDVSLSDERTGCSVYDLADKSEHAFHFPLKTSSTFGELLAIEEAIEIARRKSVRKLVIFTDSLSSCQILSKPKPTNSIACRIFRKLSELNIITDIVWTPSHKGIPGNEKADEVAKSATRNSPSRNCKLTMDEAYRQLKDDLFAKWYENFKAYSDEHPNLFASTFPTTKKTTWFRKLLLPPAEVKRLNRVLSGHTYDRAYLCKIRAIRTNQCCCGQTDGYVHQTFHCRRLMNLRSNFEIFQNHGTFSEIFRGSNTAKITQLSNFFQKANVNF
ncbi:uncharacterized protein LOC118749168 [Rhagoletis pomonella]|uniref:uncharacterized protein LOC118749168 n=1 Tax=Rhagoletis pomonella TaxID=28610 RepID=UPI0017815200|nr:uncharacterized protein LOC118749168 [Rhagoletis pomonella]